MVIASKGSGYESEEQQRDNTLPQTNSGETVNPWKPERSSLLEVREMVEAAGVEPASENVTGQENYMLSRVHAPGITLGRSRRALRTDKKRVPLACGLSLPSQT